MKILSCPQPIPTLVRTSNMFGWGDIDREYVDEIFKPKIIQAAKDAVSKMKPALWVLDA